MTNDRHEAVEHGRGCGVQRVESLPLIFNLIIKHAKGNVEQPTKEVCSNQQPAANKHRTRVWPSRQQKSMHN